MTISLIAIGAIGAIFIAVEVVHCLIARGKYRPFSNIRRKLGPLPSLHSFKWLAGVFVAFVMRPSEHGRLSNFVKISSIDDTSAEIFGKIMSNFS